MNSEKTFLDIFFSEKLSDKENYEIYSKCANPNGHGHNYVGKQFLHFQSYQRILSSRAVYLYFV